MYCYAQVGTVVGTYWVAYILVIQYLTKHTNCVPNHYKN